MDNNKETGARASGRNGVVLGYERCKRGWDQRTRAMKVGVHSWKPPLLVTDSLSGPGVTPSLFISLQGSLLAGNG